MSATNLLSYEHVMEKLPAIVADCLGLDEDDVTPDMVFSNESIEFLDLNFRCEKAFGIKSPFRLFLGSRDQLTVDAEGCFTEESVALIRQTYPFLWGRIASEGKTRLTADELLGYLTVEMIARFVLHAAELQMMDSPPA